MCVLLDSVCISRVVSSCMCGFEGECCSVHSTALPALYFLKPVKVEKVAGTTRKCYAQSMFLSAPSVVHMVHLGGTCCAASGCATM